jgi:hypothetical protein
LGELDPSARQSAETHAAACEGCREELAALRLTLNSLSALRDEEIPRRIAFVSDKVFEPRWWQRMFHPAFASACVLAAAILVHAFVGGGVSEAEVQARIDAALVEVDLQQRQMVAAYETNQKLVSQALYTASGLERQ